jgi:hypothetical protein
MTDTRPSVAVVEAVAREAGVRPVDLPPLYDTIDPDALDQLLPTDDLGLLRFRYGGYDVTLSGADDVRVEACDESGDAESRRLATLD